MRKKIGVVVSLICCFLLVISLWGQAGSIPKTNINYSGEVSLELISEDGQSNFKTDYYLYILGNPYPGLNLFTHLKTGRDKIDRLLITYQEENGELQVGDYSLGEMKNNFFNFENDQRGIKTAFIYPEEGLKLQLFGASVKGIHQKDELEGEGQVGPFYLNFAPIIPESEEITINGTGLSEDDYEIDYQLGKITLEEPLEKDDKMVVYYSYIPGGGYYQRQIRGGSTFVEKENFTIKTHLVRIEDEPEGDKLFLYLPPKKFQAGVIMGEWSGVDWFHTENQFAWSELTGFQRREDLAYDGLIRIGKVNDTNLSLRYINQGANFLTSIDQREAEPLKQYQIKGKWQVSPPFKLSFLYDYSNDNPDANPDLITTYQQDYKLKGQWELDSNSYLQSGYYRHIEGDDLIVLPEGKETSSFYLSYKQRGDNDLVVTVERGEILWIGQSAVGLGLSHRYIKLDSSLGIKGDLFQGDFALEASYLEPLERDSWEPFHEYQLSSDLGYNIDKGRISYSAEKEFNRDEGRLDQEIALRRVFLRRFKGQLKYKWEEDIYPVKDLAKSISGQLYYVGPIRTETGISMSNDKKTFHLKLDKGPTAFQLKWVDGEDFIKQSGQLEYKRESFNIISRVIDKEEEGTRATWWELEGSYKLKDGVKVKYIGQAPFAHNMEVSDKNIIKLIFSF